MRVLQQEEERERLAAERVRDPVVTLRALDLDRLDQADLARRKAEFKEMLLEKGVVPGCPMRLLALAVFPSVCGRSGSSWEKELPKFCFEPRYKELLDSVVDTDMSSFAEF
eukprot:767869-Hanusia_phi.AAC.3